MSNSLETDEDFNERVVVELSCRFCDTCLTLRGMKANLVADTTVELFSTDCPKVGYIQFLLDLFYRIIESYFF